MIGHFPQSMFSSPVYNIAFRLSVDRNLRGKEAWEMRICIVLFG